MNGVVAVLIYSFWPKSEMLEYKATADKLDRNVPHSLSFVQNKTD
jgi:hypothetical protein